MPSRKPKSDTAARPSPKERAASLKAAAGKPRNPEWGLATELHMMAGAIIDDQGYAHFCDAVGAVHRKPVADWIRFMAMRLHFQARDEIARQSSDPELSAEALATLRTELQRSLRLDALEILAFRPDAAFDAARQSENEAKPVEVDFTPWDINGPCPVPTREQWAGDADRLLPWLRIGFALMTSDRDTLIRALNDLDDKAFRDFTQTLGAAGRNFEQLHRFVRAVQTRVEAALVFAAEQNEDTRPGTAEAAARG